MIRYALVDGRKIEPIPGAKGICPGCKGSVIAKCGNIKVHHWAHQKIENCDKWWEPMSQWHIDWQSNFPVEWREVIIRCPNSGEFHRADIYTPNGLTIEFQNSTLPKEEIEKRNAFYGRLIWVVTAERFNEQFLVRTAIPNPNSQLLINYNFVVDSNGLASEILFQLKDELKIHGPAVKNFSLKDEELNEVFDEFNRSEKKYLLFDWKYKRHSWLDSAAPVFLDFGEENLYWIRKRDQVGIPLIYLQIVKKQIFLNKYTNQRR